MGPFASFAVAFSMVSITTAIFFLLPSLLGAVARPGCGYGSVRRRVFLIVLVFATGVGTPLDAANVRRSFRRITKAAGLGGTGHRASCATRSSRS